MTCSVSAIAGNHIYMDGVSVVPILGYDESCIPNKDLSSGSLERPIFEKDTLSFRNRY